MFFRRLEESTFLERESLEIVFHALIDVAPEHSPWGEGGEKQHTLPAQPCLTATRHIASKSSRTCNSQFSLRNLMHPPGAAAKRPHDTLSSLRQKRDVASRMNRHQLFLSTLPSLAWSSPAHTHHPSRGMAFLHRCLSCDVHDSGRWMQVSL